MNKQKKASVAKVFEKFPTTDKLYVTPDGQAFLQETRANLHNKNYVTVRREDVISETSNEAPADTTGITTGDADKAPADTAKKPETAKESVTPAKKPAAAKKPATAKTKTTAKKAADVKVNDAQNVTETTKAGEAPTEKPNA